jgi:hypothetical protein
MCLLCVANLQGQELAQRTHLLQLLALVESPDALPPKAALRLACEILALTQAQRPRCDPVIPPGSATADPDERRRS